MPEKLIEVLESLGVVREIVTRDATLRGDLKLDELDLVELSIGIEHACKITMPEEVADVFWEDSVTVREIIAVSEAHGATW